MESKIEIILASKDPEFKLNLMHALITENRFHIIYETSDCYEALNAIRELAPDIALIDIDLSERDVFNIGDIIVSEKILVKLILLTHQQDDSIIQKAFENGFIGYVLKNDAINDINKIIHFAHDGKYFILPVHPKLHLDTNRNDILSIKDHISSILSSTEMKVFILISDGFTSQEISKSLNVSIKTVENHRSNISKKLKLTGSHSLLKLAFQLKIADDRNLTNGNNDNWVTKLLRPI
jgi:DNA-binding NarL/FixJ family response regulator